MHGVIIDFVDGRRRKRSAVYLPDVIPEQGWTKSETIESLIKKVFREQKATHPASLSIGGPVRPAIEIHRTVSSAEPASPVCPTRRREQLVCFF